MKRLLVLVPLWLLSLALFSAVAQNRPPRALEGKWEGVVVVGPTQFRTALNVTRGQDDLYIGTLTSVDQGNIPIPIDKVQFTGESVRLEVKVVNGVFEGTLSEDNTKIKGTWTQSGVALPLELTRTSAAAEPPKPPNFSSEAAARAAASSGIPVEMTVPVPPTPFQADGKTHLVYELHVTNFAAMDLFISKLEVVQGTSTLASFDGAELNSLLQRVGAVNLADNRTVGPGQRAVAYLWVTVEPGTAIPNELRHRITAKSLAVTGADVRVSAEKAIVLGSPLRGGGWIAANGPHNSSPHRRALLPVNGNVSLAQRFAIDWVLLGANGRTFDGDPKDNKTYRAYGAEILAVADGVVVATKDGIPENVPGPTSRAVPITLETIGGNHVILDLGGGRFAFYAHMQPGSQRVKLGDKVRRGHVLGLVGNSGNSTEPHLHFHLSNAGSPLQSEGLPYLIESFEMANVQTGQEKWEARRNELPLQNARVRFSDAK